MNMMVIILKLISNKYIAIAIYHIKIISSCLFSSSNCAISIPIANSNACTGDNVLFVKNILKLVLISSSISKYTQITFNKDL